MAGPICGIQTGRDLSFGVSGFGVSAVDRGTIYFGSRALIGSFGDAMFLFDNGPPASLRTMRGGCNDLLVLSW